MNAHKRLTERCNHIGVLGSGLPQPFSAVSLLGLALPHMMRVEQLAASDTH
jgi:hypothetical protein